MINYLSVENLTQHWGDVRLFNNISFGLNEGQKVALIARNGAGKTTLLNILADIMPANEGRITLRNGLTMGYLPQDPYLNKSHTVIEEVFNAESETVQTIKAYEQAIESNEQDELGALIEKMDALQAWDYEQRIKQILSQLKITRFDQPVAELSGGQQKRVALASILISEPDLLILDEPTNHLDLEMVDWLEQYLSKSKATLLMVTHDRYFLDRVCNEIIELDDETIYRYQGNYSYFLRKRQERLANKKAEIEKARNLLKTEQEWMNRMPQARATKAKYRIDAFYDLKDKAHQNINEQNLEIGIAQARLGKKVINLHGISKSFDQLQLIKDFSYKFAPFEKVGIVGKNGTGKSTFLNILTGALQPDAGEVETGETVVFGYYRQEGIKIDDNKKVIEVISDIADDISLGEGKQMSAAQFLRYFLFPNEMHYVQVNKLSGGEKKRLLLMTVLIKNPNFLILDEPTNDLDIFTLNVLEDYLTNFKGCVIVVSHDRYFLDKVTDHLFVFEGNCSIKDFVGSYSDYNQQKKTLERNQSKTEKKAKPQEKTKTETKAKKLSYKEKRELEQLEADIENLENQKEALQNELNSGTLNSDVLVEKSKELSEVMEHLDEKELRWLELKEIEEQ
ncbi:ABC-F family ATP-binding cassette domain-containing protein [Carboxylicivirga sediminis]|uniref:ABC-F family ATP-binding cassette domain-containing protein n=1 Tax=Carboxylicivirga sediminis TaxID=2006564 RepID=A0A941F6K9_9BACT|nr:ABC-F family ATP-binding cassette domain-containing protein [Carboxylicivirga sediminis]MBR8536903.1 ABC-F family ATP-binding cassette domain-containing protein [Carboxylicivirga sediminis]